MNIKAIIRVIGLALLTEAVLLLLPLGFAVYYHESLGPFLWTILICILSGVLCLKARSDTSQIQSKEGFASTGLTWIAVSLTGMLPFIFSGAIPSVVDAFFETVSGFTTTGASILTAVEGLPKSVLFWRSFMHWVGGMGILVFMMALEPLSGANTMNIMKAESPGPSISKLVPRASDSAKWLYGIYLVLTLFWMGALVIAKMPVFDAICIALGAAGTGGFGVLNSGCADYTTLQQAIITLAMISFGVNFNFYFFMCMKHRDWAFGMEEVKWYFGIIGAAIVLIATNLFISGTYEHLLPSFHQASFHVGSIITTTGYGAADITLWPKFSQGLLVLLMFCGACAGSTGGGFKVARVLILAKAYAREIATILQPDVVKKVHMDGKVVDEGTIRTTASYTFIYVMLMLGSVALISLDCQDWTTTATSVIATFNNIGPGLGSIGTCGNYAAFSNFSKLILSADMLIGRLEIFPIMVLFTRSTWRRF